MVPYMQRQKSMGGGKTRRTKKKDRKNPYEKQNHIQKKGKFGDLAKRKKKKKKKKRRA
jgi:hypothetical protein